MTEVALTIVVVLAAMIITLFIPDPENKDDDHRGGNR